jgi:hypothetical protein
MKKKIPYQLREMEVGETKQIKAMKNTLIQARQKLKKEGLEFSFEVIKESEVVVNVKRK